MRHFTGLVASALFVCSLVFAQTAYAQQDTIYYNCGAAVGTQYISVANDTFIADLNYSMGNTGTYTNNNIVDVLGTSDDQLYRTERSANTNGGSFSYTIPVQNGTYQVQLHFAEIFYGATGGNNTNPPHTGKRVFDVSIEGVLVLDDYDIVADVGSMTAVIKSYNTTVSDGALNINFGGVTNRPKVSALVISPISVVPSSNTPPTFTISGDVTVSEDFAGTSTVTVTPDPVPPADAGQTVTYTLMPPSVAFANVSINASSGLVSITKVNNGNGSQLFTITANDGQPANNTATKTFTLTVNAVNDAPAFTTSGSVTVNENFAGTQNVTVTPATVPADETSQTVAYSLTPPSVAFANVSINASSGLVSITSVANAHGSQLFTITANDGQAANNIATQTFTLTVNDTSNTPSVQGSLHYNAGGAQYVSIASDTFKVEPAGIISGLTSVYTNPTANLAIAGTDDDALYRTERSTNMNLGSFGYNIPVQNGTYTIKLHFAEIFFGATGGNNSTPPHNGKRVFDVTLEGALVLDNYDIFAEVGAMTAVIKEFNNVHVTDGNIDIDFTSSVNKAKISAISIIPVSIDPPTDNTPPSFTVSGDVTVAEDFAGTQTVTVTPNPVPPAESGQVVTYSLTPPSVAFANVSINSSSGLVSITKVNNANGSQLFTITANDGQATNNIATQTFTLTVNAVNDAPAFTTSGNVSVNENFAGSQTVTVTPAAVPADETAQTVTYTLTPPSVAFANVSINANSGTVTITSVFNGHGSQLFTITANDGQAANNTATGNFTLTLNDTTTAPQKPIHLNSGTTTQYISLAGDTFKADNYYSSGTTTSSNNIVADIAGTDDDVLYRTERFKNDFTYTIPVQNGSYTVKLHFAEIFYGVNGGNTTPPFTGKRVFHVVLEGDSVLKNYDINADVGPGTAVIKQYNVNVSDGNVTINLKGVVNNAKISAISVIPAGGPPNTPPTVSISAPSAGASFIENTPIQIDANPNDTDGFIAKVEFYQNENSLGTDFTAPFSFTWNNATPGPKALTAKAFDDDNASTNSAPVNINVIADAAPAVSITSPANNANFQTGSNITINASASDDLGVTHVEFYEGLNLLGSDNSSPFSFTWNNVSIGDYTLTAKAYDGAAHSTTSAAITVHVLADTPPTVSITSPANGASFNEGQTITINATAGDDVGVNQVDFYAGVTFLGSDNSAPYSYSWTNAPLGGHALTAVAFDTQLQATTSSTVNITVNTVPVGNLEALFVVGNTTLNTGDQAVKTRLEALGFNVTLKSASASVTADANGKNLVLISSTVTAASVGTKFTNVAVPVIDWEQGLFDDLGMTSGASGNSGTSATTQTQLNLIGAGHPLAGGLSNTAITVHTTAQTVTWGKPSVNAVQIATTMTSSTQIAIFGYETGAAMVTGNAPARRVGFFLQDLGAAFLTANGTTLLDAAITWAANSTPPPANNPPSVSITSPANGATFTALANITIDANASDPDAGGSVSKVEFYEGLNLLGTDFTAPYSFAWNSVGAGSYQLTAKAFDNLNASATSAVVNITVNPAANNPPSVSISSPANGATFTALANITIDANASDPDAGGSISKVEFYEGLNLLGTDFTAPYSFAWNNVGTGNYQLTAKAFDNLNASATSTVVNITVNPAANNAPVVSITNPADAAVFTAPANITIDANASDPDAGGSISKVEFYEGLNLLGTDFTAPYSFAWNSVAQGNYALTAKAFDNVNASTTSAVVNITVNQLPTVSITSPANGATFTSPANITIDANAADVGGSISKVEFYQGITLLGTDFTAPYSFAWNGVTANSYSLTAKAFDNLNATTTSSAVNITVNPPTTLGTILLVVGNTSLNTGDNAMKTRIESLGYSVLVKLASASVTADATGKSAVVISATVTSTDVGNKFTNVAVPVMNCEQALHDDLNLVSSGSGNAGSSSGTTLSITGAGHPLAAGLANGTTTVFTSSQSITWGKPSVNAVKIASTTGSATQIALFGYEANAAMVGLNAPARRVGFFAQDTGPAAFNANGNALFDAAINWLVATPPANNPPSVSITSPANGASFTEPANITIDATASDPDAGGSISKVEFYQGAVLLGTDFTAPYSAAWNGVTAGSYQLTAKAFDNLNVSTTSSIVNITVNPPANNPPTVSITSPANGAVFTAPANITIDANANDVGGSISKVEFYQGAVLLGTDFSAPYSFAWNGVTQGNYALTAKAFDNLNVSTTSTAVNITVNQLPTVSITNPANGAVFTAPANITIDATANDVGGSIAKVEFYQGAVLLGTDFSAPYSFAWNGVTQGNYALTAKAFDDLNATTTSSVVNVVVNQLPTVSITSPANGAVFTQPVNITIDATANDVGGSIAKVEFYFGATLVGTDFTAPYSVTWNNAPAGTHQLTAKAFDNLNATTTSAPVSITVNPGNQAPVVNITNPVNNANFTAPANVSIQATATDDGSIAKVEFYVGATLLGTDMTSPYGLNWNGVGVGNYALTAKAYDNLNVITTSSVVNISVTAAGNNPPTVSITSPTTGAVFTAPANITIDANAADAGGSISKVEFYQGVNLLGTDFTAPYSFAWNGVAAGTYQLTAKAFDNQNATTTSSVVSILVNNPSLTALFVVGSSTLNTGDAAVKSKLESLGYSVAVFPASAVSTADATGKSLVLISSTVVAGNVGTKFTNVAVPLINWESGVMDDLQMTGPTTNVDYGTVFNQTQINITGAGHPLAAGLPNGVTTVVNSLQTITWGKPSGSAVSIATVVGQPTQIVIFGYTTGSSMVGLNAPARRVGFLTADNTPAALNAAGLQLLEAAILWATSTSKNDEGEVENTPAPMEQGLTFEAGVYPNPSMGAFNIKIENAREGKLTIGIYNYTGQAVYFNEQTVEEGTYTESLDLTDVPTGLYLIQLTSGEDKLIRRVLISR